MKMHGGDGEKSYPRKLENLHSHPSTTSDNLDQPVTLIYLLWPSLLNCELKALDETIRYSLKSSMMGWTLRVLC